MKHLTVPLGPDLLDLADARGVDVQELVSDALRRYVEAEGAPVRDEALRLARRHAVLLRRLGE
ncbi:hypothetical protein ACFW6S_10900 [Streptomyces sp. NPDC058740]|uniref:hypothetical protein n=1 Tax=unclassified Streptomyces TaxID=2593676 RepID=UPI0036B962E1